MTTEHIQGPPTRPPPRAKTGGRFCGSGLSGGVRLGLTHLGGVVSPRLNPADQPPATLCGAFGLFVFRDFRRDGAARVVRDRGRVGARRYCHPSLDEVEGNRRLAPA
jgi:hypothetical protein